MIRARVEELGQIVMVRLDARHWTAATERLLGRLRPGGVLFAKGAHESPQSTAELLRKIALAAGSPPFLVPEDEPGSGRSSGVFSHLPSPGTAAREGAAAAEFYGRLGTLAGATLKALGFNTCLGPVLDLSDSCSESLAHVPVGSAASIQAAQTAQVAWVAQWGEAFIEGLERHKIHPCGKHFPGLSAALAVQNTPVPVVAKPMAQLWREDLVPYRQLLGRLPMVLMSHASYKAFDFDLPCPAALSDRVVQGLLRVRLGYEGVAVAERIEEEPVRGPLSAGEAALKAVNAGCDLILVRDEKSAEAVIGGLKSGLESARLPVARVEQTLERIGLAKRRLAMPVGKVSRKHWDELLRCSGAL